MTSAPELLDRLLLVTALLGADQERFQREHGLSGARLHLLWQLGLTGPARQADLAAALGVTPRNVTGLVDGLVGSGHVTRAPHPTDRRALRVSLTDAGEAFVTDLRRQHDELAGQLFAGLPATTVAALADGLDVVAERLGALVAEAAGP